MDEVKRYVNLSFIVAAMVASWLYVNIVSLLLAVLKISDIRILGENVTMATLIGIGLGILTMVLLWRNAKVYTWALNVAYEMKKVTWPTGDETKYAMKVVIIMAIIVACILFCFDMGAKTLTDLILGIK